MALAEVQVCLLLPGLPQNPTAQALSGPILVRTHFYLDNGNTQCMCRQTRLSPTGECYSPEVTYPSLTVDQAILSSTVPPFLNHQRRSYWALASPGWAGSPGDGSAASNRIPQRVGEAGAPSHAPDSQPTARLSRLV